MLLGNECFEPLQLGQATALHLHLMEFFHTAVRMIAAISHFTPVTEVPSWLFRRLAELRWTNLSR